MKVLITGATGFIGSNLTSYLIANNTQVAVLLRKTSNTAALSNCLNHIKIYRTNEEYTDFVNILNDYNPEVVIHLSSLFLSQHAPEQVDTLIDSNILFATKLLEAMAICKIKKFINTGTSWQHFNNAQYNPVNLYAATKQAFENICEYYSQAHDFKIITLKLFETYGPGDPRKKIIPLLLEHAGKKEALKLSAGAQKLDFVHIDDICRAYDTALEQVIAADTPGHKRYGISSGMHISLKELVATVETISNTKIRVQWGARPYRAREIFTPWTGFDKLPGWRSQIPLKSGLKSLFNINYRENFHEKKLYD